MELCVSQRDIYTSLKSLHQQLLGGLDHSISCSISQFQFGGISSIYPHSTSYEDLVVVNVPYGQTTCSSHVYIVHWHSTLYQITKGQRFSRLMYQTLPFGLQLDGCVTPCSSTTTVNHALYHFPLSQPFHLTSLLSLECYFSLVKIFQERFIDFLCH